MNAHTSIVYYTDFQLVGQEDFKMWNTCSVQALTSSPSDRQIKMTAAKTSQPAETNQNYTYSFFFFVKLSKNVVFGEPQNFSS